MPKRLSVYAAILLAMTSLSVGSMSAVYASSLPTPTITSQQAEHEVTKLFSIPSYYKLSQEYYDINAAQGQSTYNLVYTYTMPDGRNHYVNVTVSASDGHIMSFSRDSSVNGFVYPLPVSATKAKSIAMVWAKRLFKNQVANVRLLPLMPNSGSLLNPVSYQFNFERIVHGIPAPFDGFSLTIDQNGDLIGASDNWTKAVIFPTPSKAVSLSQANQVYKSWTNLYMAYTSQYSNGKSSIVLTYQMLQTPNAGWWSTPYGAQYSIGQPTIDALTGRVITSTGALAKATPFVVPKVITPNGPTQYPFSQHVNWSREEALAYAQKVLGISSAYHLTDANLSQSFPSGHSLWSFNWSLAKVGTVNATVDATGGTVQSFWRSFSLKFVAKKKLTQTMINQAAKAFVAKLFLHDNGGIAVFVPYYESNSKQLATDLSIEPIIHGIPVTGLTGNIQVNGKTGVVQSYWGNFSTAANTFVSPAKAISTAKATDIWANDYPLTEIYALPQNSSKNAVLLYAPINGTNGMSSLNALTGQIINTNTNPVAYTGTIKDSIGLPQQTAIALLAQYGLLSVDASGDVHPQNAMTRASFVKLVVDALGQNQPIVHQGANMQTAPAGSTNTIGYSEMQAAFNRGWLSKGKLLHPNSLITRGDAAQILARALGYAGVMNHTEIFTLPAKDATQIAKDQLAGDAIAYALGMLPLENGKFVPNGHVTIADAALAIVRLATAYNEGQQLFSANATASASMGAVQ